MKKRYWIGGTVAGLMLIGAVAGGNEDASDQGADQPAATAPSSSAAAPSSAPASPSPSADAPTANAVVDPVAYSHDDVVRRLRKQGYSTLKNDEGLNRGISDSCATINNRPLTGPVVQEDRRAWLAAIVDKNSSESDANAFIDNLYQACRDLGYSRVWVKPMTLSQEQAVGAAEDYLEYSAFSRQGLIDQLSSEFGSGFPVADATYAVDHVEVDWNQQAVRSAREYLRYSHFSRAGLIDQLSSAYGSQFTYEQAVYGVDKVGL